MSNYDYLFLGIAPFSGRLTIITGGGNPFLTFINLGNDTTGRTGLLFLVAAIVLFVYDIIIDLKRFAPVKSTKFSDWEGSI